MAMAVTALQWHRDTRLGGDIYPLRHQKSCDSIALSNSPPYSVHRQFSKEHVPADLFEQHWR